MREQSAHVNTGMVKRNIVLTIIGILVVAVLYMGWKVFIYEPPYVPPEYEVSAVQGTPKAPDGMSYNSVSAPTGFSVALCGVMYQQQDASLMLYLTNPDSNEVNLRCEIKNEAGEIIYQSGVLRPGEYVESLQAMKELSNEAIPINVYIYAYKEDTWYSEGTLELSNTLQPY